LHCNCMHTDCRSKG